MTGSPRTTPKRKPRWRPGTAKVPSGIAIPRPIPANSRLEILLAVLGPLFSLTVAFLTTRVAWQSRNPAEEVVVIYEEKPPPPPEKIQPVEPVAKPVPPDPASRPPKEPEIPPEPPKPVFGLQEEALEGNGDLAVATGNTLMKAPDLVVHTPVAPLPPAPVNLDREPEILRPAEAAYPAWAEEQGVTAKVELMVTIDAGGAVTAVDIKTSGGKDFDKSALEAIRKALFKPLIRGGTAVPARFTFTFDFRF